jgi:TatD DNase family protein
VAPLVRDVLHSPRERGYSSTRLVLMVALVGALLVGESRMYVDVHSHAHELSSDELTKIFKQIDIVVVGVSDDYESSLKTLELSTRYKSLVPCVGVHPWTVNELGGERALKEARRVIELALEKGLKCFGEIGLDTKFVPESIEAQREVFTLFLEAARDNGILLNLHTAGTWREVFELLIRYDIGYANFHWYTGPVDLVKEIAANGYTISINPAVRIQQKHRNIVAVAPLEAMLTESDAPYKYRGMELSPLLVPLVVETIADIKGVDKEYVKKTIAATFREKWGSLLEANS